MAPFNDQQNLIPAVLGVTFAVTGLATIFVCIRFWVVFGSKRGFYGYVWEDLSVFLGALFNIAAAVTNGIATQYGFGRHSDAFPKSDLVDQLKWITFAEITSVLSNYAFKLSVGIMLIRVGLGRVSNVLLTCTMVYFTLVTLVLIIINFVQCRPFQKTWNRKLPGNCSPRTLLEYGAGVQAVSTIIVDLILTLGPEWFLRKIKLSRRNRLTARLLLCSMLFATIFAILKVTQLGVLAAEEDVSYTAVPQEIYNTIETNISGIAACLPAFKQFVDRVILRKQPGTISESRDWETSTAASRAYNTATYAMKPMGSQPQGNRTIKVETNVRIETQSYEDSSSERGILEHDRV
ncbi:MAG: hypothetical protein M1820_004384 [Bogoriella megaspora]|nr:MAG: hypothetical protein M1820_004384 [Bogoriella megaspora]